MDTDSQDTIYLLHNNNHQQVAIIINYTRKMVMKVKLKEWLIENSGEGS